MSLTCSCPWMLMMSALLPAAAMLVARNDVL